MSISVEDFAELHLRNRWVVVVGNAPFGEEQDHRHFIDAHDVVIRLNNFQYNEGRSGTRLSAWFVDLSPEASDCHNRVSLARMSWFRMMHGGEPPWLVFTPYADGEDGGAGARNGEISCYTQAGFVLVRPRGALNGSPMLDELRRRSPLGDRVIPSIGFQTCARLLAHGALVNAIGLVTERRTGPYDYETEAAVMRASSELTVISAY